MNMSILKALSPFLGGRITIISGVCFRSSNDILWRMPTLHNRERCMKRAGSGTARSYLVLTTSPLMMPIATFYAQCSSYLYMGMVFGFQRCQGDWVVDFVLRLRQAITGGQSPCRDLTQTLHSLYIPYVPPYKPPPMRNSPPVVGPNTRGGYSRSRHRI